MMRLRQLALLLAIFFGSSVMPWRRGQRRNAARTNGETTADLHVCWCDVRTQRTGKTEVCSGNNGTDVHNPFIASTQTKSPDRRPTRSSRQDSGGERSFRFLQGNINTRSNTVLPSSSSLPPPCSLPPPSALLTLRASFSEDETSADQEVLRTEEKLKSDEGPVSRADALAVEADDFAGLTDSKGVDDRLIVDADGRRVMQYHHLRCEPVDSP
eukprot:765117-Hanusia_phi.AAC.3